MDASRIDPVARTAAEVPPVEHASYPIRGGNLVRPLIDGIPAFGRIGEAVEAARHSVWLTVAFVAPDFRFPVCGSTLFDKLDHAASRGSDVRILFWRPNPESIGYGRTFPGSQADREMLEARASRVLIRWDRAPGGFCQHQKSWIIDGGQPTETAFVGGINLTAVAQGCPGHSDGGHHDLYVEVAGPSATDVHHNFVQRWNEASERDDDDGCWPVPAHSPPLAFPTRIPAPRGSSKVQIQRTIHPGRYRDGSSTPGGRSFYIDGGERSILRQYLDAIDAARVAIHIENQALPVPEIAASLEAALARGVDVALLVPSRPEENVRAARRDPAARDLFASIEALGRYDNFALCGLAAPDGSGGRLPVYVHAKAMLVDDVWATIGSCNLHRRSLSGHAEMNAAIWDGRVVAALRRDLILEHTGIDTADLDAAAAARLFRRTARENRARSQAAADDWQGYVFALDPEAYAW